MRQTKRRLEVMNFFDHTGIEAHMEKMARKGWLIQRISTLFWIYRRIPPKKLHFCVSYYPKASEFDPEPTEAQKEFLDFCRHTGWTLACTSAQMQIFYNEQEDPVPIETDPMLEVETIHAAVKRNFLIAQFVLLVCGLLNGVLFLGNLFTDFIRALANPSQLLSGLCWLLVVILSGTDIATYFVWHKKALAAAEQGIFLDTYSTAKLQKGALVLLGLGFGYYLLNILISSDNMMKFVVLLMLLYMILMFAGVDGIKRLLKHWKVSRNVNRAVTFTMAFVLAFGMAGAVTAGALSLERAGFFDQERETYTYGGMTWVIHQDEIPLRVEDLMEVDYDEYSTMNNTNQSIFLARKDIWQQARLGKENAQVPEMHYTIVAVKMPFLYDACREKMLEGFRKNFRSGYYSVEQMDSSAWDAKEVWGANSEEGWITNHFLLCYEAGIVEIWFDWDVTDEQKAIVGQILGAKH